MSDSNILTGQYVRIKQTAASVGDRVFAQLIDWGVLLAYTVLTAWITATLRIDSFWFYVVFGFFPVIFYTPACEIFNHGQSIGKIAMKLRVVKADGSTPSVGDCLMRWLLFIVDGPLTSFMGLIPMVLTQRNQRLGDLAAGTMVIRLQDYKKIQVSLDEYDFLQQGYKPRYPQAADLSLEQIEIISRTIGSPRSDFDSQTALLARKVEKRLGIKRAEQTDAAFLNRLLRDYQYYALEEI